MVAVGGCRGPETAADLTTSLEAMRTSRLHSRKCLQRLDESWGSGLRCSCYKVCELDLYLQLDLRRLYPEVLEVSF